MHQKRQFLEAEKKKQMRIPVPPEMPEMSRNRFAILQSAPFSACVCSADHQDQRGHNRLRANQLEWMRKISREEQNHRAGKRQIAQRHAFECAEIGKNALQQNIGCLLASCSCAIKRKQFATAGIGGQRDRCASFALFKICSRQDQHFIGSARFVALSVIHRAAWLLRFKLVNFSGVFTPRCSSTVRSGACVHCKICQPRKRAMPRSRRSGLMAKEWPTASSIQRSSDESPYALHLQREIFCSPANSRTARAFSSANIAEPATRPVNLPALASSLVAITATVASIPRQSSSRSSAAPTISASGKSVPLTSTIASPRSACHQIRCTAAGTNSGIHAVRRLALIANKLSVEIPRKYNLLACVIARKSRAPNRIAAASQKK